MKIPRTHRYGDATLAAWLVLSKHFNAVSATAYLDVTTTGKPTVLDLGADFGTDLRSREARCWQNDL